MFSRRSRAVFLFSVFAAASTSSAQYAPQDARMTFDEPETDALAGMMEESAAVPVWGAADSTWWTIGLGVANDFDEATDVELFGSFSYFLAKDVEFAAEVGGWYFNQPGDDAAGLSASMVFRWHFVNNQTWSVFADIGIGVLGSTDDVPAEEVINGRTETGSSFNLLPRVGVGFTRALDDAGTRLLVGLRWHHISNARIFGDDENPGRDAPMLYAGVVFPF